MARPPNKLEDEDEIKHLFAQGNHALQQIQYRKAIEEYFYELPISKVQAKLRKTMEDQEVGKPFELIPLNIRYRSIIQGLDRKSIPEVLTVTNNLESYKEEILAMSTKERPEWSQQYDKIIDCIVRVIELKKLYDFTKKHFKAGNAMKWYNEISNPKFTGKYTLREISESTIPFGWTETLLDETVGTTTEKWTALEAFCQHLDMEHRDKQRPHMKSHKIIKSLHHNVRVVERRTFCKELLYQKEI